jgi:hypothetical protein
MSAAIRFKQINDMLSVTTVIGGSTRRAYDREHVGSRSEEIAWFGDVMAQRGLRERRT